MVPTVLFYLVCNTMVTALQNQDFYRSFQRLQDLGRHLAVFDDCVETVIPKADMVFQTLSHLLFHYTTAQIPYNKNLNTGRKGIIQ